MKNLPFIKQLNLYFSSMVPVKPLKLVRNFRLLFFMAMWLTGVRGFAQAPTVSYAGPQVYPNNVAITPLTPTSSGVAAPGYGVSSSYGSGFSQPYGVALDVFGNIYVADAGNNAIKKIPVGGGAPVNLGSGFNNPKGIAFKAGNLYIADYGNNAVKKMPIAGGTPTTLATGLNSPEGISLDVAGNVYVSCAGDNSVKEILVADGTVVTVATGFNAPAALTIDAYGNVYVADTGNNQVQMIPAAGGSRVVIGRGFTSPMGVAVDASGNVYVADSGNNHVKKIYATGGVPVVVGSNFTPYGIIVDNTGNIYTVDHGNALVKEIKPIGGYFIHPALPAGLLMSNATGTISGTPVAPSVATNYTVVAYNASGSATATVNIKTGPVIISYGGPKTYTLHIPITPLSPTSSGVAARAFSSTAATVATGFNHPTAVAIDHAGNLYVADPGNNAVEKVPAGSTTGTAIGSGFIDPTGVAVDPAGNVYVADFRSSSVVKIPAGGGGQTTIVNPYISHPYGVAIDSVGTIATDDPTNHRLSIIFKDGAMSFDGVFEYPGGLSIDAFDNVFVPAKHDNGVYKASPQGPFYGTNIGSGFSGPTGTAVDPSGNVYVGDSGNNLVKQIQPDGTIIVIGPTFNYPAGLAVDTVGNVYVTDENNSMIRKIAPVGGYFISRSLPLGLSFDPATGTISGTAMVVSPATNYTITGYNGSGSGSVVVNIAVLLPSKPTLTYASPHTYVAGGAIAPLSPTAGNVNTPAYNSPIGIAGISNANALTKDANGNLYVANYHGNIEKIPAGGGSPIVITTSVAYYSALAVDGAGNLYASCPDSSIIKKFPANGGVPVTIGSGFSFPMGLAVDTKNNVYVADEDRTAITVIPANGGSVYTVGSGFVEPIGVTLDSFGNIYICDAGNNAVKEIPVNSNSIITLTSNISSMRNISVDPIGNIYVGTYTELVQVIPAGGGTVTTFPTEFGAPEGIYADAAGIVYIAVYQPQVPYSAGLSEYIPSGGYYLNKPLPKGLTLNTSTGVISGTPLVSSPATDYIITAYNDGGGTPATVNIKVNAPALPAISYTGPNTYTTGATITPLAPTKSRVFALNYNSATITLGSGFNTPNGVALDAAGNIYVADSTNNAVKEIPVGGGAVVNIGSGFSHPTGVAVDAAGNIYVADNGNNAVKKIPVGNGTPASIGSGFLSPFGVAVDAAGNVYVADSGNNAVKEIPFGGTTVSVGSGFSSPVGVAIDAAGNVYVADAGNNAIKKIPVGGGAIVTLGSGFISPHGVAVDGGGNLFVADQGNNGVGVIPSTGAGIFYLGSGFVAPTAVAVDGLGNVYVADVGNSAVKKVKPSGGFFITPFLPGGLKFNPATGIISGKQAAASPSTNYTVTGYNITGGTSTTVNIAVSAPANLTLSNLTISNGSLAPAFAATTTAYSVNLGNGISSVSVTPTVADPTSTLKVNGNAVVSGTASAAVPLTVGANTINTVVTANDGQTSQTYTITVIRAASTNAKLLSLTTSGGGLTPTFNNTVTSYTRSVPNSTTSITITPKTVDPTATVTVNGTTVTSGTASGSIALITGNNVINTVVTAQDGITQITYTITVTRAVSADATLSKLSMNTHTMAPQFIPTNTAYTDEVDNSVTTVAVTPITNEPNATVKINGVSIISGTESAPINIKVGSNTINIVVTAQNGVTTKNYKITVTRLASDNAYLNKILLSSGVLSPSFSSSNTSYTVQVTPETSSITLAPTLQDRTATVTVNGTATASGTASAAQPLVTGNNTENIQVTAQNGLTTITYTVIVNRGGLPINTAYDAVSIDRPLNEPQIQDDGILVHQGISPNGDGINDFLLIDGIANYPDNKLQVMNRSGQLIFEVKNYDNSSKVFDGHSNKTGAMQFPGTYFYSLDYVIKGEIKHKTGFIVLKW